MDFGLTNQQEMLRNMVSEYAETELAPKALELDEKGEFPFHEVRRVAEQGLVGIVTSKEYGGSDMGHLARVIAIEEISRIYPPLGFFLQVGPIGMYAIETAGTEEQKKELLPSLCRADSIVASALTEASGGSDPQNMQTTAVIDGNDYVLNGRKMYISFAEVADIVCLVAKSGDNFNSFIVKKGTPGFEITRRERHNGLRSIPVNEFALTDCRIPGDSLLGAEGKGLGIVLNGIAVIGRMGLAGVGLGIAQGCYETALSFAKERRLYEKPIAQLQAIQFMLVDMNVEIEATRLLVYRAGWTLDQGKGPREAGADIARAKLHSCELANRVAFNAIRILGACGTTPEYHVIRRHRDAMELLVAAGSQEIMKVVIGGAITR